MKTFDIPQFYRSSFITEIKNSRKSIDPRKKDYKPTLLDFGSVRFYLARHFGFCYGVENAIEIAYKTIEENPGKRIFLLSKMIHNPGVNEDLQKLGVKFLMDTSGEKIFNWDELHPDDIVIIPAFGTTLDIEKKLNEKGINPYQYNTTCPFVEKVWNRSSQLGDENVCVIIHGKHYHEETRATFSHTIQKAPSVIVRDIEETKFLASVILNEKSSEEFYLFFDGKYSAKFIAENDLVHVGVVNQTTEHFADTRDTLCYATNDNQEATYGLLNTDADLAIIVGGYNSSNTGHIVELCEKKLPTFFISSEEKIVSKDIITHFSIDNKKEITTENFLPPKVPINIVLTSGASCPDAIVESVLRKILTFYNDVLDIDEVVSAATN
ncbi:MAG: 4-hydroxy-3-methylbut-2-enyl diphosphate reductase [Ignavibacteriaceae bacterium]